MVSSKIIYDAETQAYAWHKNQFRQDGKTPYFEHVKAVAILGMNFLSPTHSYYEDIIAALYMHDIEEDCLRGKTLEEKVKGFSPLTYDLCTCLTDPTINFDFKVPRDIKLQLKLMRTLNNSYGPFAKILDRICNVRDISKLNKWSSNYLAESIQMIGFYGRELILNPIYFDCNEPLGLLIRTIDEKKEELSRVS